MGYDVLFFVPNVIGYIRLVLFGVSIPLFQQPHWFLAFYGTSIALDAFDGYFARKLNQTSKFGAWFDVVIDLISRGGLWCMLTKYGYFMILVEWLTFLATHSRGPDWKATDDEFPYLCKLVMANNFKTPLGAFAVSGVHGLPIALYCQHFSLMTPTVLNLITFFLTCGRILALRVEFDPNAFIKERVKGKISFFHKYFKIQNLQGYLLLQIFYIQIHLKHLLNGEEK